MTEVVAEDEGLVAVLIAQDKLLISDMGDKMINSWLLNTVMSLEETAESEVVITFAGEN